MTNRELIDRAAGVLAPRRIGDYFVGDVGCALETERGAVHVGVCIDTGSGIGFCAEHSAIAAMVTAGETRIRRIVAVWSEDNEVFVLSPCGRCRQFIRQIDDGNLDTEVILGEDESVPLRELLPYGDWSRKVSRAPSQYEPPTP